MSDIKTPSEYPHQIGLPFDVHDTVWFMHENKARVGKVTGAIVTRVEVDECGRLARGVRSHVVLNVMSESGQHARLPNHQINSAHCYPTKEALLASL